MIRYILDVDVDVDRKIKELAAFSGSTENRVLELIINASLDKILERLKGKQPEAVIIKFPTKRRFKPPAKCKDKTHGRKEDD